MGAIHEVLTGDLADRFVILGGATAVPGAVFGEILTAAAQQRGSVGVLVEGSVRDRPSMTALGLPVYAVDEQVVGPNAFTHITAVDQALTIGGTTISPDDHIVADATGCVRIPGALLDEVLDGARRYAAAEDLVAAEVAAGQPLNVAYRHKKSAVDELRRSSTDIV
jgi:4-hydroxy-4-methyl-2-oxoglutarate aldolase